MARQSSAFFLSLPYPQNNVFCFSFSYHVARRDDKPVWLQFGINEQSIDFPRVCVLQERERESIVPRLSSSCLETNV